MGYVSNEKIWPYTNDEIHIYRKKYMYTRTLINSVTVVSWLRWQKGNRFYGSHFERFQGFFVNFNRWMSTWYVDKSSLRYCEVQIYNVSFHSRESGYYWSYDYIISIWQTYLCTVRVDGDWVKCMFNSAVDWSKHKYFHCRVSKILFWDAILIYWWPFS